MTTSLQSPAYIAAQNEIPVREVWTIVESLDLKPSVNMNGTAYFDRTAIEAIEHVIESQKETSHE